jgi:hypothetical protein
MNRELKRMRNNAEIIERRIEKTKALVEEEPNSVVDWKAILKAEQNLLSAIHDCICDLVIEDTKKTKFWKKLFRK